MTDLHTAAKLALVALEQAHDESLDDNHFECRQILMGQITALRQAVEQPVEQEPFCYHDGRNIVGKEYADHSDVFPLYTRTQAREPLTDEQIEDEWERITGHSIFGGNRSDGRTMYISPDEVIEFARAIEAALRSRNENNRTHGA